MTAPGPLSPTQELSFRAGAETLYGEWFVGADVSRGVAIILHGYAEHIGRYREVAHVLSLAGYAVLGYDMRGHGKSTGRRGHVDRFAEYIDDFDAAWAQVPALATAAKAGPRRILLAHSNGGLTALRMLLDAQRRPAPAIDAAIISSPFLGLKLQVPAIKRGAATILSRIMPSLAMANELKVEQLTHDKGKQAERLVDTLCNDVATARWFTEAMATQALVRAQAGNIKLPTLWTIAGADVIADPQVALEVAAALGQKPEIHLLEGFCHEVFNEVDRARAFDLVTEFLTRLPT